MHGDGIGYGCMMLPSAIDHAIIMRMSCAGINGGMMEGSGE